MTDRAPWPTLATRPLTGALEIEALAPEDRGLLAAMWARRARSELGAGVVFSRIAGIVAGLGLGDSQIVWLAARAVSDEVRHAELCRALASRYAGRALPWPKAPPVGPPRYRGVAPEHTPIFYVVHNCAINETIGTAYLAGCLEAAATPPIRAVIRELMRDEVDHARIGWAVLGAPQADAELRAALARALPELVSSTRDAWLARAAESPDVVIDGHGCLSQPRIRALVEDAIDNLVLPGFAHVDVDPAPAREAVARARAA
ncbi:MAG: hypothetical protein KC636_14535 [Myxococcales bacterium]|nr:hypothetical protein [Myxococcales bacterium]